MNYKIMIAAAFATAPAALMAQTDTLRRHADIEVGANKAIPFIESTAAVSVISSEQLDVRSSKDVGNSLVGKGSGLFSKQTGNNYASSNPTFYVRGLQSLSTSVPLVLVDGIERELKNVSTEEVAEVQVLKDAAAVALYGTKGANGVILIKTKRGVSGKNEITFSYDHTFESMRRKPQFVDALTYANAMNEARANDGLSPIYSDQALSALASGEYAYSYPNVNWADEVYGSSAMNNKFNLEFRGGSDKFKYYALLGLISDKGFLNNTNENDGYSTQNKYVRGNLRINLDAELTKNTKMHVNLLGVLLETSRPGDDANLWDMIYSVPSAAFPIKNEDGSWGGNSTWAGTKNPVAQSQGAAYSKNHQRSLFFDVTVEQNLDKVLQGLSAQARVAYDSYSQIHENHSKTYVYGMAVPTGFDAEGNLTTSMFTGGADSEMGTSASTDDYAHIFDFDLALQLRRSFGQHSLYSQLKWQYENKETYGVSTTVNRQNLSLYNHYGYKDRYFADLTLMVNGSSRLAPDSKWSFSPTLGAAWVISREAFMQDASWINMLKLRGSAGVIHTDYLPNDIWTYYLQSYNLGTGSYVYTNTWTQGGLGSGTTLGQMATTSLGHEKAYKYNLGLDATLFKELNFSADLWWQNRTDIWVETTGKYTGVLGFTPPYENGGKVYSHGVEFSADWTHNFGKVQTTIGGNFAYSTNEITEQYEEPKAYANLVTTGSRIGQVRGLEAIGFFKDEADIAASPTQTFTSVRPGDIKYRDINGDNIIDSNDEIAIGYSSTCPEITYNFHLGAEYQGLGFYANFQGVGRYSGILNTKSTYWPLVNNTTISQHAYDNRWTPENPDALYPRLSSQSNTNNYRYSTLWLQSRNYLKLRDIEVYYHLPEDLLSKTGFIKKAKVYVKGTDLFSIDSMEQGDPESYGASMPMSTSIVAGVKLTF